MYFKDRGTNLAFRRNHGLRRETEHGLSELQEEEDQGKPIACPSILQNSAQDLLSWFPYRLQSTVSCILHTGLV